ncbi:MAG: GNAT family N-acetyltransferase [Anaerolineales bacterium]
MKTVQPAAGMGHIRDIAEADIPAVLDLNLESVHFLSPLSRERLEALLAQSAYYKVLEQDGRIVAFVLAFCADADYDSPNFLWFKSRYASFLYIDRLVVREGFRNKGFGKLLYQDLLAHCRERKLPRITCEVDIVPPNPVSLRFHQAHGFREVGSQWPYDGKKQVALMEKRILIEGASDSSLS